MKRLLVSILLAASAGMAQAPVPRPAGPLWISGKDVLAQAAGRPVVLAFVSTQCPHCAAVARVMQDASRQFSAVLFQAVAFDEGADAKTWSQKLGLSFPAVATDRQTAMKFLGLTDNRLGTPMLQSPDYMRSIVGALLKGSHDR